MNNKQKYFMNNNHLRTIIFVLSEGMFFLKYKQNEKSNQTNKIETTFSSLWLFCLFCILQKIKASDCQETTVTFTNGISTGGKSVSDVAGFIEFTALSKTSGTINKEQSKFKWNVTKIVAKTDGTGQALETDTITFYTILADPTGTTTGGSPWNVADTTIDNKIQPWITALEFAIATANTKGQSTPSTALGQLTTYLHSGHGMTYDTTSGESGFGLSGGAGAFQLSNYINKTGNNPRGTNVVIVMIKLLPFLYLDVSWVLMFNTLIWMNLVI
jgi:hypothetical protein